MTAFSVHSKNILGKTRKCTSVKTLGKQWFHQWCISGESLHRRSYSWMCRFLLNCDRSLCVSGNFKAFSPATQVTITVPWVRSSLDHMITHFCICRVFNHFASVETQSVFETLTEFVQDFWSDGTYAVNYRYFLTSKRPIWRRSISWLRNWRYCKKLPKHHKQLDTFWHITMWGAREIFVQNFAFKIWGGKVSWVWLLWKLTHLI